MAGYLIRSSRKRPEVTLKLAVSSDGMIGRSGEGQVAITGALARRMTHVMRAEADAIMVGIGTALADDPELTCRLPGLENRSPTRIVIDPQLRLPLSSTLAAGARTTPLMLVASSEADRARRSALEQMGIGFVGADIEHGRVALPELLEDLAAQGVMTLLLEGGAALARSFLDEDLVDRLALFGGPEPIGERGIPTPLDPRDPPSGFVLARQARYDKDDYLEYARKR
jgi:diaminohydroxyphosphoribosylaminopyrimidine deaminase/5-amino-6-(5-phosphoribosylamino)uracil reductase